MRVTFLAHSGFLIELEPLLLLFDWWKGELPPLTRKASVGIFQSQPRGSLLSPYLHVG